MSEQFPFREVLTNNYIAMQYWAAEFSAIVAATQKGITVVQAAGNGNEDFDQAIYANSFLQQDSGAIVVGAGVPPTNFFDSTGRTSLERGLILKCSSFERLRSELENRRDQVVTVHLTCIR